MRVAPAEMADLDTLADLWVRLAADQKAHGSHLAAAGNRAPIRESLARHVSVGGVLVARDDGSAREGDVVGFVMFDVEAGAYDQTVTRGTVRNLFVVPGRRDEGIGGELLDAAEADLRDAGVDVVALDVMAANDAAVRFYRRRGYRPHRLELEKPIRNDTHSKEDE